MDSARLENLHNLIESGFADLRAAIVMAMDLNETCPGASVLGWPPLPVVTEHLSLVNRTLAKLVETLPAEVEVGRN